MQIEELKKGFWGYRKEGIFQYITAREAEFSQRLLEKDAQAAEAALQARERIQALEEENRALREELQALRSRHAMIADTLLDAKDYAGRLKEESRAQEERAQAEIRTTLEREMGELAAYQRQISALRRAILDTLEELEGQAGQLEERAEELAASSPAPSLSLAR